MDYKKVIKVNKSEIIIDKIDELYLDEANSRSLSRIQSHMKVGRSLGIISSERTHDDIDNGGDGHKLSKQELNVRHANLKSDIKKAGFSYTSMHGNYHGNHERSIMVFGKKEGEDTGLHSTLMHLGQKYGQDSIIHKTHDSEEPDLHFTMNRNGSSIGDHFKLGKMRPQRTGKFGSTDLIRGSKEAKANQTAPSKKTFAFSNGKEIKAPSKARLKKSMSGAGYVRDNAVWIPKS